MSRVLKVVIAGNRSLRVSNMDIAMALINLGLDPVECKTVEIVCGGASGVDDCAKSYSELCMGKPATVFEADWAQHGKAAGPIRNEAMARYADRGVLFFKGQPSPGTANMLAWLAVLKKPYWVVTL